MAKVGVASQARRRERTLRERKRDDARKRGSLVSRWQDLAVTSAGTGRAQQRSDRDLDSDRARAVAAACAHPSPGRRRPCPAERRAPRTPACINAGTG
eukprot:5290753-Pleurochrysis_carterae.AAC.1